MLKVPNLPEKEFKRLLQVTPMLCVDAVITNEKGQFLLEVRTYPPYVGLWHVPGGFVGYDERLAETAKRKALQETGLTVKIMKYLNVYDEPDQDSRGRIIVHTFLAKAIGGKLKGEGLKWFDRIPDDMVPFQKKELKDAGFS